MNEILLLRTHKRALAALFGALDPLFRVATVGDPESLLQAVAAAEPQACILDLFDSSHPVSHSFLHRLRHGHPNVALVIASDFSGREMELYHLGRLFVDGVIRMEEGNSPRDILSGVERAIASSLATRVLSGLHEHLPPLAQEAARWAIEHAEDSPQVSEMARALGMSSRVFLREMRAMGAAAPRDFLLWGRILRASQLLERSSSTVESVAFQLGYATGGTLGRALKKHVGASPSELLREGGLHRTLEEMKNRNPLAKSGGGFENDDEG